MGLEERQTGGHSLGGPGAGAVRTPWMLLRGGGAGLLWRAGRGTMSVGARRGLWGGAGRGVPGPERRGKLDAAPVVQARVAGVSFQDRQEAVAALRQGEGLLLMREPLNEFDPRAIHVRSLGGRSLGYVPRDRTHLFPLPTTLAFVAAVGAGDHGLWGLTLCSKPTLPPLTVEFTPTSCHPRPQLGRGGLAEGTDAGPQEALERAVEAAEKEQCCGVCGAPATEIDQQYEYLEGALGAGGEEPYMVRIRKFVGVRRLCAACSGVRGLSPEEPGEGQEAEDALQTLMSCNRWTAQEAEAHLACAQTQWKERSGHEWAHDFSALRL